MSTTSGTGDPFIDRSIDALLLAVEAKRAGIENPTMNAMQGLLEFFGDAGRDADTALVALHVGEDVRAVVFKLLADQVELSGRLVSLQLQMAAELLDRLSGETGKTPIAVLDDL